MENRVYGGITVEVTPEGYLEDFSVWTEVIAEEIAKEEGIVLTSDHFYILKFLRKCQSDGEKISIRRIHKSGLVNLKTFYTLFPGAALRKAARIAGIPKPENCV
jgi:dissimilatory sulfite reductase related protein